MASGTGLAAVTTLVTCENTKIVSYTELLRDDQNQHAPFISTRTPSQTPGRGSITTGHGSITTTSMFVKCWSSLASSVKFMFRLSKSHSCVVCTCSDQLAGFVPEAVVNTHERVVMFRVSRFGTPLAAATGQSFHDVTSLSNTPSWFGSDATVCDCTHRVFTCVNGIDAHALPVQYTRVDAFKGLLVSVS